MPTFHTNCPHVSHFAQMGSHFAQNTTTNPCSELSSHKPLSGICMYTKHPQPHPTTPLFLAWMATDGCMASQRSQSRACSRQCWRGHGGSCCSYLISKSEGGGVGRGNRLKVGKMNYCLGKLDPNWAKCLKSEQNFSRSGQKKKSFICS